MFDLSGMGYLIQTHVSAGRIPTDKAFRFYVDTLGVADHLSEKICGMIDEVPGEEVAQVEEMLMRTTHILAGLTQFVGLVTAPKTEMSQLQRIEFLKVGHQKILVILITKAGVIRNKVIASSEDLSQNFLNSIASFLNEEFKDHTVTEIRRGILESIMEDKKSYDQNLAQAVRLGKKAFDIPDSPEVYMEGQMNLLFGERSRNSTNTQSLMDLFEHKNTIMEILDHTIEADGVGVFIGVENQYEGLKDCSMIVAHYKNEHNILGCIGVIGPTCMDYKNIIPVVDYTAKILSQAITEHSYQ